jgi:hypothetical protein
MPDGAEGFAKLDDVFAGAISPKGLMASAVMDDLPPEETFSEWIACEKCVARSLWKVSGVNGYALYFCGHHKNAAQSSPKFTAWATTYVPLDEKFGRS